ncbi:MAG: MATE family efflux transporter [Oscillospiraceae bacterium]|nr:MATE family efflux transporter [Oscillospiraceae bacterium]
MNWYAKFFQPEKLLGKFQAEGPLPENQEIMKKVIGVAWPAVLESFLVALVAFVDNIMVSSLGAYAVAAVGLTTQPKFIAFAFFVSLNVATSALVARRKGEDDRLAANRTLKQVLAIMTVLLVIVITVFVTFAEQLLLFVGAQPDTIGPATEYFRIVLGFGFFQLISMTINAAQRGVGNTKIAMRTNMISNIVNVFFNWVLIGGNLGAPALGVKGAAIATVIGSAFACFISIASICKRDGYLYIFLEKGIRFDKKTLRSVADLASSTLAEQIFMRIGFLLFTMVVSNLGTEAYAAHQVGMNCMHLSFAFGDGFNVAAVSLVGQSLGAKRKDLAAMYGSACQRFGMTCSVVMCFFFAFCGEILFSFFFVEPEIIAIGGKITKILAVMLFLQIRQVITAGCLKGAGDTRFVAKVAFISVTIIRPLGAWLFCYPFGMGVVGAWAGTLIDQSVRCGLNSMRFATGKWSQIDI